MNFIFSVREDTNKELRLKMFHLSSAEKIHGSRVSRGYHRNRPEGNNSCKSCQLLPLKTRKQHFFLTFGLKKGVGAVAEIHLEGGGDRREREREKESIPARSRSFKISVNRERRERKRESK